MSEWAIRQIGKSANAQIGEGQGMTVEEGYAEINRSSLEAQLSDVRQRLAEMGIEKAILFGSVARGDVTPFSDLDLVIVQRTNARFLDRLEPFYAGLDLRVDADILVYTPEEWAELQTWNPFIQQVIREGEVIYDAESA